MKKPFNLRNELKICLWIVLFLGGMMTAGFAANPVFTEHWKNLSGELNTNASDNVKPEIIIEGNTIHTVWIEYKYNETANIWYRRSTDLGKTWEEAQKIFSLVQKIDMPSLHSFARMMAVNGNTVHITFGDWEWTKTGAGRLYYARSLNGGQSFEPLKELSTTAVGAYVKMGRSQIVSVGNKVAIAYERERWIDGNNRLYDIRLLYSSDNGDSFKDTLVVDATKANNLCDFYYDGNQMIILHHYAYYYYGFHTGRVYATVSNDNGLNFTTTKISKEYLEDNYTKEKSLINALKYYAYRQHIFKSGNNIHIVFEEYKYNKGWLVKYVRSTDNGATFAEPASFEDTQGTTASIITGKENKIYIGIQRATTFWLKTSTDGGDTFSEAVNHLDKAFTDVFSDSYGWAFNLTLDPRDDTGSTVLITGNTHLLATITDNGTKLKDFISCIGERASNMTADLAIDNKGVKHWLIYHKPTGNTDFDIYYRSTGTEPEPGEVNKAFEFSGAANTSVVVPYSESLAFDSLLTVEMWVKFDPTKTYGVPLVWKSKGNSYSDVVRKGFAMRYVVSKGEIGIKTEIWTDIDKFAISGPVNITDTLWHHLAFTFDADGGKNNFIGYIDGIPFAKTTVAGSLDCGNDVICLTPYITGTVVNSHYKLDEVRIWRKALTPAEIQQVMTRKDFSNEKELKLYLTFDDTFKDISGNGNDAVPMKRADRVVSDFNPPIAAFEAYKMYNEISTINKSKNATTYNWIFDEKSTSSLQNPKHQYTKPGEYEITLKASNDNAVTSVTHAVSIEGLERISPVKGGNGGYVTITVYGGGLETTGTTLLLRRENETDIQGHNIHSNSTGSLSAYFDLSNKTLGKWSMVVNKNGKEQILDDAFEIVEGGAPDPWVNLVGRGMVLINRGYNYAIQYGNKGDIDALGVTINIVVSDLPGLTLAPLGFKIMPTKYAQENHPSLLTEEVPQFVVLDDYFGTGNHGRLYTLIIPRIEAGSSQSLLIRIKSEETYMIESWVERPMFDVVLNGSQGVPPVQNGACFAKAWGGVDEKTKLNGCITLAALDVSSDVLSELVGMVLPIGCATDVMKLIYNPFDEFSPKHERNPVVSSRTYGIGSMLLSCVGDLTPIKAIKVSLKATKIIQAMYEGYQRDRACREAFDPRYKGSKRVIALWSFDPNEMIGPTGVGDENWIQLMSEVPYTILFENKKSATAPAHDVVITDTLDLNKYDLNKFSFGSFGWGDTIILQTKQGLKEFSRDIDLRPAKELIVRVAAKLYPESGVVKYEFKSLNPTTLEDEEDPFLGFLPPNDDKGLGEGFVSFTVGLKQTLSTGDSFKNKASIVFDSNPPIITNEYVNTIDLDLPESKISKVEKIENDSLRLTWTSSDAGSGVKHHIVYMQKNDEEILPVLINAYGTCGTIKAETGATYKFYSEATDNVGWKENKNGKFDIVFVNTGLNNLTADKYFSILPNPAKDYINIQLKETLPADNYDISLLSIDGRQYFIGSYSNDELHNGVKINVKNFAKGLYLVKITYEHKVISKKVLIE